jgi:hypothetical protein
MTKDEEIYLFVWQSIGVLNDSLNIMSSLKDSECIPGIIFNAAFRYALIEYSKRFGPTNGLFHNDKKKPIRIKHDLTRHLPKEYLELHERIILSRNQYHAHADMTVFDSKMYIQDSNETKIVTISRNIVHGCDE